MLCARASAAALLAGAARLAGSTGAAAAAAAGGGGKRDAASLDAFLGTRGSGSGGGGPFGGGAPKYESLDAIEQILFQAAPADLSAAIKPRKKHKAKRSKGGR